jgi:hypothetical protein
LLFLGEVADGKVACSYKVLESFIVIVSYVYLFVDSSKTQAVSNDKRVHIIILWQVIISIYIRIQLNSMSGEQTYYEATNTGSTGDGRTIT